jgi:hypothetical protein
MGGLGMGSFVSRTKSLSPKCKTRHHFLVICRISFLIFYDKKTGPFWGLYFGSQNGSTLAMFVPKCGTVLKARFRPQKWDRGRYFKYKILKDVRKWSHFRVRNLAPKTVPLFGPNNAEADQFWGRNLGPTTGPFLVYKKQRNRPMRCGNGTTVVPPKYLQEKHRFASMWTRHRCLYFREGGKLIRPDEASGRHGLMVPPLLSKVNASCPATTRSPLPYMLDNTHQSHQQPTKRMNHQPAQFLLH